MKEISRAIQSLQQAELQPIGRSTNAELHSLEVAVRAELPSDYKILLNRFGAFAVDDIRLCQPSEICSYAASIWNLHPLAPSEWIVLPIAIVNNSGDSIGFLRSETHFTSAIYLLDHEITWRVVDDAGEVIAPNFAEWIVKMCERPKLNIDCERLL